MPSVVYLCHYDGSSAGYVNPKANASAKNVSDVVPSQNWALAYFPQPVGLSYGSSGSSFYSGHTYYFYVSWRSYSMSMSMPSDAQPTFFLSYGRDRVYPKLVSLSLGLSSSRIVDALYSYTFDEPVNGTFNPTYFWIGYNSPSDCMDASVTFSFSFGIKDVTDSTETQTRELIDKFDQMTDFNESQQTELGGTLDSAGTDLESKLGVLSFADQALTDFISVFSDDPGPAQLTLPGFKIEIDGEQHEVWADTPYSLASLEDDFGPLLTAVRFGLVVLVYAALIGYLGRVLDALLHGSEVKEE